MRRILGEIQDGEFAREWIAEDDAGRPELHQAAVRRVPRTRSRRPARKLRGMMSWVDRPITETA